MDRWVRAPVLGFVGIFAFLAAVLSIRGRSGAAAGAFIPAVQVSPFCSKTDPGRRTMSKQSRAGLLSQWMTCPEIGFSHRHRTSSTPCPDDAHSRGEPNGLTTFTPKLLKSATFLVTTVKLCTRAVAAIIASS